VKDGEPVDCTYDLGEDVVKIQGHSSLRRMQCPFSIRQEVLPDVNSQLRGFNDDVDDMSRKSKSKDHTKALNIPLTLTQEDLLQEALAVTFVKDQTQSFLLNNIDVQLSNN
jgi:hypothetical protein